MASKDDDRRLTTSEALEIGMAVKDPGAYMFASLVVGLVKLPFSIIGAVRRARKQEREDEAIRAKERQARLEAEKREAAYRADRMERRRKELLAMEEQKKKREILDSMMAKEPQVDIKVSVSEDARKVWLGEEALSNCVDHYLYALELVKTAEGRAFVAEAGLDHAVLTAKLHELYEAQKSPLAKPGVVLLTPRVKKAIAQAGKIAAEKFKAEHPGENGTVTLSVRDLLVGAVATEGFVKELEPVWEHLRKQR